MIFFFWGGAWLTAFCTYVNNFLAPPHQKRLQVLSPFSFHNYGLSPLFKQQKNVISPFPQKKNMTTYAIISSFESDNQLLVLIRNSIISVSFSGLGVKDATWNWKVGGSSPTLVNLVFLVESGVSKTLRGKVFEIFTYQLANKWQFNMACTLKIK